MLVVKKKKECVSQITLQKNPSRWGLQTQRRIYTEVRPDWRQLASLQSQQ